MPYGPHTPDDRAQMLAALGISTVDELFADIPRELRASPLNLPPPEPELELSARLSGLARRNRVDMASFLGGSGTQPTRRISRRSARARCSPSTNMSR